jgi:peptidoglycan/LPS O-acetylase OafA/YrhL
VTAADSSSPQGLSAGARELWHRPAGQLPGLDGLRALAVLLVICDHWVFEWTSHLGRSRYAFFRLPLFHWGWTGVDLFFVLSGFLIGQQLWREVKRTGRVDLWRFFLRRGLRIWPLYYAFLAFLLVVSRAHRPQWPDWVMLTNYSMTPYGRSWSLATEEQFYLLMPLLLIAIVRLIRVPSYRPFGILALLGGVALARLLTRNSLLAQGITGNSLSVAMYAPFHLHCEPLLVGLLVAWVAVERPGWLAPSPVGRIAWWPLAIAIGGAALGGALRAIDREVFSYLALGLVYGGALVVALTDRSWITAPLRSIAMYPIARLSYGMYLNHLMIPGDAALALAGGATLAFLGGPAVFWASLGCVIVLSATAAALTFIAIEQPGLRLRDRLLRRARAGGHRVEPVLSVSGAGAEGSPPVATG